MYTLLLVLAMLALVLSPLVLDLLLSFQEARPYPRRTSRLEQKTNPQLL